MRSLIEYAEISEAPMSEGFKWAALLGVSELLRLAFYAANFSIAYRYVLFYLITISKPLDSYLSSNSLL